MFAFVQLTLEKNRAGRGIRVLLVTVLLLALQAVPTHAASTDEVDELIAAWRADWRASGSFDLGQLDRPDMHREDQVVARLASMARWGLTAGNDPLDGAFALFALGKVLDGKA